MILSKTRLYRIWRGMKKRCYNPNHNSYKYYGGKGISVCEKWKNDFMSFKDWALRNGYNEKLTIDRIDSNSNYCSKNCRWVSLKENLQNRNMGSVKRSSYKLIKINNFELCLADWAKVAGISKTAIYKRFKKGTRGFDLIKPATR